MRHTVTTAIALGMLAATILPVALPAQATFDPMEKGRDLTQKLFAGDMAAVAAELDEQMTQALGGEEGLKTFGAQLEAQLGAESAVKDEQVSEVQGHTVYQRTSSFEKIGGNVVVVWSFNSEGKVAGLFVQPAQGQAPQEAASEYLDYQTKTALRLPFDDEWTVYWGGRTVAQNYHAAHSDQRFAYDIVIVRDGSTHTGDGRSNSDYHCFGVPILAPGAGTVVVSRDGLADNAPGEIESPVPAGNHVVIDHGNGEFSFVAHLREGSVRVGEGDHVAQGDTLGLCGNSGRSSEPHLHYHLQTTPEFGAGEGLPAQFLDYLADGEPVVRGEPTQGQKVSPGRR